MGVILVTQLDTKTFITVLIMLFVRLFFLKKLKIIVKKCQTQILKVFFVKNPITAKYFMENPTKTLQKKD